MDEHEVLDDERDEGIDGAGPDTLEAPRGDVGVEALARRGPDAAGPGEGAAEQDDGPPADGDGKGHQHPRGDAVDDHGRGREQRDAPHGRAVQAVDQVVKALPAPADVEKVLRRP